MTRVRAALDLPDLGGFPTRPDPANEDRVMEKAAEQAGFRTRHANGKPLPEMEADEVEEIDARRLGRAQGPRKNLNITITPAMHRRFWLYGQRQGLHGGYNILEHLLKQAEAVEES